MSDVRVLLDRLRAGERPDHEESLALADVGDTPALAEIAGHLRDLGHRNTVTYSRKVFIPLTHLCRDVCHCGHFEEGAGGGGDSSPPICARVKSQGRAAFQGHWQWNQGCVGCLGWIH